jgi:uncharacterized protein YjbI with pentapeptide repeats
MGFLFRSRRSEQDQGVTLVSEEHVERTEHAEQVELRPAETPEGLISATELPSAADALEDLFREGAPPPKIAPAPAVATEREEVAASSNQDDATQDEPKAVEAAAESVEPVSQVACDAANASLSDGPTPAKAPASAPEAPPSVPSYNQDDEGDLTIIDLVEQVVDDVAKAEVSAITHGQDLPPTASAPLMPVATSDWALEERLAGHKEWVESRGVAGTKVNLAGAKMEGAELIGVNLRHADLQDANLKSADLLLADLRDACLVRTNFEEACLVGANLEGANLEGAALDTAMGLVPRQLAGANLHEASLPEQIAGFEARPEFQRMSKIVASFFIATMVISGLSCLAIWKTKDIQLLSDSSIIPFLHSQAANAALPTAQMYLIAPVFLFITYLVLHFHLQRLWDAALELPGTFPDGHEIGHEGPRIVTGLLRAHFRWMNRGAASTRIIERVAALLLAYWIVPATLLLFWARYLTMQDLHGTTLHELLLVVAVGVALYSTMKVGRPQERWSVDGKRHWHWVSSLRDVNPLSLALVFGFVLTFLAIGTVKGAPHDKMRAPQFGESNIRRWAPTFFWSLGFEPYADLTEASLSSRPANWNGSDEQVSAVRGARLNNTSFRYAQAYGVFLANAHLWRANFQGAFLSDADMRGADLGQSTLRYAIMDRARLQGANLDRSNLDGANLDRADFREANLSYCSLTDAILVDAQFQGAVLYGAHLTNASMERANLEKADVRSAYLNAADLEHADLQQAYFWSAKVRGANLRNAQLTSAIFIEADLNGTDLRGAQFEGTVLNGTDLTGTALDGADLRGALGLTAGQVCSAKSRSGAWLPVTLAPEVQAACGGPLLVAPVAIQPDAQAQNQGQSQAPASHR